MPRPAAEGDCLPLLPPGVRPAFAHLWLDDGDEGSGTPTDGQQALAGRARREDAEVQHRNAVFGRDA